VARLTLCGRLVNVSGLLQTRLSLTGEPITVQQFVPPEGATAALLDLKMGTFFFERFQKLGEFRLIHRPIVGDDGLNCQASARVPRKTNWAGIDPVACANAGAALKPLNLRFILQA